MCPTTSHFFHYDVASYMDFPSSDPFEDGISDN